MLKALIVDDSRVMRVATRVVMERLGLSPAAFTEHLPYVVDLWRKARHTA